MSVWRRWIERLGRRATGSPLDWMIVGLGNPGPRYAGTRHNVGREAVEAWAARLGVALDTTRFTARFGIGQVDGLRIGLTYPLAYMNVSGRPIVALARFFKVPSQRVLVVFDDLDLPVGKLRLRADGGAGGHNGVKSLIDAFGSPDFPRLRIGIGRPPGGWDPADYVLARFTADERIAVELGIDQAQAALEGVLREGLAAAMNRWNG